MPLSSRRDDEGNKQMTYSVVNGKQSISAQRSLGASGNRRGLAALVMAAVVVVSGLVSSGVAEAKGTTKPPPTPTCYYTGSGYGDCEGYIIPGGGTVVPLTVANKKDKFKLKGPAPLQSTKPVACGDAGLRVQPPGLVRGRRGEGRLGLQDERVEMLGHRPSGDEDVGARLCPPEQRFADHLPHFQLGHTR